MDANSSTNQRLPLDSALSDPGKTSEALQALRQKFDAQLACLNAPGVSDTLRSVMSQPINLNGVKVGTSS